MFNNARDQFFEEHGDHVLVDGFYIFADGSTVEDSPYGRISEPPEDAWERSKLIARYYQIVAETTEQQFLDFKMWLQGHGRREDAWATLYTTEDQLKHLKYLRSQAMRARAKYSKAKKAVTDSIPAWMVEREESEAEDMARKQKFRDTVDSIDL